MLKSWNKYRRWWDQKRNPISFIDHILQNPPVDEDFYDRALWIKSIVDWLRRTSGVEVRVTRLRYLLNLLDRNPEWKVGFTKVFELTLADLSFREALCNLGLPVELSFFGEIFKRIGDAVLPREPVDSELSSLLHWIFPDEDDAEWIAAIDSKTTANLFEVLKSAQAIRFERDRRDALLLLSTIVRSIGLSNYLRGSNSGQDQDLASNVFFKLSKLIEDRIAEGKGLELDSDIKVCLRESAAQIEKIYHQLESSGVSIEIVYQLERLNGYLSRIELLLDLSNTHPLSAEKILGFFSLMIRRNVETRSLRKFVAQNISLLSKRIVQTNSEVGEHYITRDGEEARMLLKTSIGGGMITAATVYFKILTTVMPGSPFLVGLLQSTNYSISFLVIQLRGFTLASKQPANTAPALAHKLHHLEPDPQEVKLVDEVVHLVRSQASSIFGNVVGVVPLVLALGYGYQLLTHYSMISAERAEDILHHHDLLGGTWIYAAFTGVLLFASSVIGGAADNWFKFRRLGRTIARNETLVGLLGRSGARKVSDYLSRNFSGIASSIGLGFLLGLLPQILSFIGIPLEVRHVTLAFGTVAVAIPLLPASEIFSWMMLRIFVSLIGIGVLNVTVSFSLALWVALRSQDLQGAKRRKIFRLVFKRFQHQPLSFFWPTKHAR